MTSPRFSIITPTYNGMKFFEAAVKSVLGQSFESYEYIIVDDCSTDGTRDYVKCLSENNEKVHGILLEQNGGIGNARNVAIAKARGEYLLFLDQDDFFSDETFFKLDSELKRLENPDVLCFGFNRVNEQGSFIKALPPELEGKALRWDLCTVWTYVQKTDIAKKNNIKFPVDCMNEDMIFSLQVARYAKDIKKIDECIYNYRVNEQSTSKHMSQRFDKYPDSRRLVFYYCKQAYDGVSDIEDKNLIFLTALAYYYSIQFGIFRKDERDTRIKEYRLHRKELEKCFEDYLHGHSVTLFRPKCRRFIYRLVVWVSYHMEKYFGQAFFEWFILRFN